MRLAIVHARQSTCVCAVHKMQHMLLCLCWWLVVATAGATSVVDCVVCPRGTYHIPFPLPQVTSPVSGGSYIQIQYGETDTC